MDTTKDDGPVIYSRGNCTTLLQLKVISLLTRYARQSL